MSVAQSKLIIRNQTKEQYIAANILKYKSDNLIILYHCAYSGLLVTAGVIVQNFIKLMRYAGFGP